jgi:hypothetical protein
MAAPDSPRPATKRSRRRLAIALAALAVIVAVRAALPEVLRRVIESKASAALGRQVRLEDVDLGLVMGRVLLEGIAVGGPRTGSGAPLDPASEVVRCQSAGAQIAWLPLLRGRIHLREIALASPMLRLDRNPDGSLAPLVLAPSEPEPEPPPEKESGGGIDLAIDRLALDRAELRLIEVPDGAPIAELRFEQLAVGDLSMHEGVFGIGDVALRGPDLQVQSDRLAAREPAQKPVAAAPPSEAPAAPAVASEAPKHRVKDLNIEGMRFAWRLPDGEAVDAELEVHARDLGLGAAAFPLEVRLSTDGATLALEGKLAPEPLRFDGTFKWEGVRLDRIVKFAPEPPVKIASGRSDGSLEIALRLGSKSPDEPAGVQLQGDLRVQGLDLAMPDGALALRWKDLALALDELKLPLDDAAAAPDVHLTKISLDAPQLDFTLQPAPASQAAAPAPAAEPAETPAPAAEKASPPPHVRVDALELTSGAVRFRDTTVRPPVDTALRDLRIRAQNVRWPERDVSNLVLTAKGQRAASLELKGSLKGGAGNLGLELRELPLATFDPYAAKASGLSIQQGRLTLRSQVALGADRMGAKSTVALHQLRVNERESGWFKQSFGVPLDVAIALLQDLNGDITLPVDVEQGAGGTQVGVAAAVTAALRQALVGALAAPLKLLSSVASTAGSAFSSGLDAIPMEPGQGEPGPDGEDRIGALADLLGSRPGLRVALVGHADASDDPALARRQLLARAKAGQELPGEDELGFFERRRVRSALADADPEQPDSLDAETRAALDRLAGHVKIDDSARQALALARAQSVAQSLQQDHGVPADSVMAIETGAGAPGVEIELRGSNQ